MIHDHDPDFSATFLSFLLQKNTFLRNISYKYGVLLLLDRTTKMQEVINTSSITILVKKERPEVSLRGEEGERERFGPAAPAT